MDLRGYLSPEQVVFLQERTKKEALDRLCCVLAGQSPEIDLPTLQREVHKREHLMSTGIGNGLAIPHVRLKDVSKPYMAVGLVPEGVPDYATLDEQQVVLILLIAAPLGRHDLYLQLLSRATETLKSTENRQRVFQAGSAEEVHALLTGQESGGVAG